MKGTLEPSTRVIATNFVLLTGIAHGTYVAVSASRTLISAAGENWTIHGSGGGAEVAFASGFFVADGRPPTCQSFAQTSVHGVDWEPSGDAGNCRRSKHPDLTF